MVEHEGAAALKQIGLMAAMIAGAALITGCGGGPDTHAGVPVVVIDEHAPATMEEPYRLGTGDTIRMLVYNEPKRSGDFEVDGSGQVALPLIGELQVKDLTVREFEAAVQERLREGYLVDPRVSAEITNYRPFFITGDVTSPGRYPFSAGLTVQNAIALAGGYTVWADPQRVLVDRTGRDELLDVPDLRRFRVLPGDTIRIPQRRPFS